VFTVNICTIYLSNALFIQQAQEHIVSYILHWMLMELNKVFFMER